MLKLKKILYIVLSMNSTVLTCNMQILHIYIISVVEHCTGNIYTCGTALLYYPDRQSA